MEQSNHSAKKVALFVLIMAIYLQTSLVAFTMLGECPVKKSSHSVKKSAMKMEVS